MRKVKLKLFDFPSPFLQTFDQKEKRNDVFQGKRDGGEVEEGRKENAGIKP